MDQDRVIGSAAAADGVPKQVPSLARALCARPQLLALGDPWLAPDGGSDGTEGRVQNASDRVKET